MIAILSVLSAFCIVTIVVARYASLGNAAVVFGSTVIFLFATGWAWVMLLVVNAVPVDAIAQRSFGLYDVQPWRGTVIFGPPLLGALVFAAALWRRGRPRH
jgi:hypothetical protein